MERTLVARVLEIRNRAIDGYARTMRSSAKVWMLVFFACGAGPAGAQMQLPGANAGASHSGEGKTGEGSQAAPPRPVTIQAPGEDTIVGHMLSRDGSKGEMIFIQAPAAGGDKALAAADRGGGGRRVGDKGGLLLSKLTLVGDKISKPGQVCAVDVALAPPFGLVPAGRPAGTLRYGVPLPACPFSIDVLEGAVLVTGAAPICEFAAADCRVSPVGLWGPPAAEISAKRTKELERERARLETAMRANFKALLRKAGKDKVAVKAVAHDQAAFSSDREMTCRDYQGETVHGFCSTMFTQARTLALVAQFGPAGEAQGRGRPPRRRPKPSNAPAAATAQAPPAQAQP